MNWKSVDTAGVPAVPSMLNNEEKQFLYWYAKTQYSGTGEMVDLGAFLGASAAALGAGLRENATVDVKSRRIHSYDFFSYIDSFYGPLIPGEHLNDGDDTLPVFWKHLGDLSPLVTAVKGDITAASWSIPIELLFVDFTQNWQHHEDVVRIFYPHLQSGAVLVHQDYNYVLCYWLHIWMEYYWENFELISLHIKDSSAAWRLIRPLPSTAYDTPLQTILDTDELLGLIDRSFARYAGRDEPVHDCLLRCARARFFLHAHGKDAARREAALIPDIHPDISHLKDEIERFDPSTYAGFFKYP